jgi:5-enolpyruvylshikimate-3-phosphate synthase
MLFPAGAIMRPFGIIVSPDLSIVTYWLPAGAVAIQRSVLLSILQPNETKKDKT